MEELNFKQMGFKVWMSSPLFNKKKWFYFIVIAITIGVIIGLIFASILFGIQEKKDPNMTFQNALNAVIVPSLYTGVTIVLLIVAYIRFKGKFPFELLILSVVFLTGLFSTISTKSAAQVFIGIGIIFLYLGGKELIPIIVRAIRDLYDKLSKKSN